MLTVVLVMVEMAVMQAVVTEDPAMEVVVAQAETEVQPQVVAAAMEVA